jgi:hypothetical protein
VDVNGDGRLDVVVGSNGAPAGVVVLLNLCGQPSTDLSLTVTDSPDPVVEGNTVTYSAIITNLGANAAPNATFTQVLPSGYAATATSSSGACTVAGRLVSCNVGLLASGASATVDVVLTTITGTTLTTTATVSSDSNDSDLSNNSVTTSTVVTAGGLEIAVVNTNDSGPGSLRQAIIDSNADSGDRDTIVFNIPGAGVRTITPLTALPTLSQPVIIDGATQPGFAGTPLIELNGSDVAGNGLWLTGGNSLVRGLAINRFGAAGIRIDAPGGNVIQGNRIGTNAAGTSDLGNTGDGIAIFGGTGTIIGGTSVEARNIVSGNNAVGIRIDGPATSGTLIYGNYIGVDATGSAGLGNNASGVAVGGGATMNVIGAAVAGAGNVISGNGNMGVTLFGAGVNSNVVSGNRIGTDAFATTAIPNAFHGVNITDGANNVIGSGTPEGRNVISGNSESGVSISGAAATGNFIEGNLIGTNGSGTSGIANQRHGVVLSGAPSNFIGLTAALPNVISGNGQNGVAILGEAAVGNWIGGSHIGVNVFGTAAIPNALDGIRVDGAPNTSIGAPGYSNFIGGNGQHGIGIYGGATTTAIFANTIGLRMPLADLGNALDGIQINNGSNTLIGSPGMTITNTISENGRNGVAVLAGSQNQIHEGIIFANGALGIDLGNDGVSPNDALDTD